MKKLLFTFLFLSVFGLTVHAQNDGFRLGAHGGFPFSDAKDFSSFNFGLDASYLFPIKNNIAIGAATGYSSFIGKDDFDSYSFLPVAVSGRVDTSLKNIFYTADVGYAIAFDTDTDGGLYYQVKTGWTKNNIDIFAFYKGISADGTSISSFGLGVAYKLKQK